MSLAIRLFGPLEARYDGEPLGPFEYNKVRALLAFLAMEGPRPHSRASLSALLWPEQGDSAARQNLSQALTTLRKVLRDRNFPTPLLLTTTDSVGLNPSVSIDVDALAFNALIDAAEAHRHRAWHLCSVCAEQNRRAATLYRDDFLAQLYVSDSATFEEWALLRRERLRQRMLSTLERLLQYAEWRGAFDEALLYARRQVEMEPLRDGVHRTLMRLLALDGQQAAALAQYDFLRRMLDTELGEMPEQATIDLAEQIKGGQQLDALRQLHAPASTIPEPPTPIVGRDHEREQIVRALVVREVRALTVLGPPGVGKTRLALDVAHTLRFHFEHGVHVVELAPIDTPDAVLTVLVQTLQLEGKGTVLDTLSAYLKERHVLLVFDNFEHVLDAAADIATLLKLCPALGVVATSRTPLNIRAEQQFMLEPLPLPPLDADDSTALATDSVRLLMERVRVARPDWTLAPEAIGTVVAICRRTEGLPLALELLAPRLRTLAPADVLQQLERRLAMSGTAARDVPLRHRTLRSAIQWSYDRLDDEQRRAFAHLGVFAGSCTADALAATSGVASSADALLALNGASIVVQHTTHQTRWTFLETIREFALEILEEYGEVATARQRHAAFFARFANEATSHLIGPDQPQWSAAVAADMDNIRAALRWSLDSGATTTAITIGGGIWRWWWQRGLLREGLDWLERALHQPHEPFEGDCQAMRAAGNMAIGINDFEQAKRWFHRAREMAQHFEEVADYAAATTNLGLAHREVGELDEAARYLAESIELARTFDPAPRWYKFPVQILARVRERQGRFDEAVQLFDEGLRLNRAVGDAEGTADALTGAALYAGERGDFDRARAYCQEAHDLYGSLNHQFGLAWVDVAFGHLARQQGDYGEAVRRFGATLATWRDREDPASAAEVIEFIADVCCRQSRFAEATTLMSAAEGMRGAVGAVLSSYEQAVLEQRCQRCRDALGAAYESSWERGRDLTIEQVMDLL